MCSPRVPPPVSIPLYNSPFSPNPTPRRARPMAEQHSPLPSPAAAFLRRLQERAPHSPQLLGFLTLFVSAAILVFLSGLTAATAGLAVVLLAPLVILTSPVWVPVGFLLFVAAAVVLSLGGLAVAAAAGLSWAFRYLKGMQPPGSERLEYARSRIYDTATHVKDYAREYGGYLQSKVKDAAPGA